MRDNPALFSACKESLSVTAVFFDCSKQWSIHGKSPIQYHFVEQSLNHLSQELGELGIEFMVIPGSTFKESVSQICELMEEGDYDHLYLNQEPGWNELQRDNELCKRLANRCYFFNSDCVIKPGDVTLDSGDFYKVFTPYKNRWFQVLSTQNYEPLSKPKPMGEPIVNPPLEQSGPKKDSSNWPAGEQSALARLDEFCNLPLVHYSQNRDFPALSATSELSPYLAIGVISPKQCLAAVMNRLERLPTEKSEEGYSWVNEIIWREFYRHLLYFKPSLSKGESFKAEPELKWQYDEHMFQQWADGNTGYPIVDAAMRCLNQTGFMHNRLRMVVASFLTKDLLIDWRWGESYFMKQLIDGDFAANNGGWQWASGTGADAAPFFRIFNPTTQSQKFDPKGQFIKRWIPELNSANAKDIHAPEAWLEQNSQYANYPSPIVCHKRARIVALNTYQSRKQSIDKNEQPFDEPSNTQLL